MRLRVLLLVLVAAAGLVGCSIPNPPCDLTKVIYPGGQSLAGAGLRLGIVDAGWDAPVELAQTLRGSGAQIAVLDDVRWGYIEPSPPLGSLHTYEWNSEQADLDARVAAYQAAGFTPLLVLRSWNPWARAAAPQGGSAAAAASTPPAVEFMDAYADWVQAIVERYDADGVDDAPTTTRTDGAVQAVVYYQIETEAANGVWWQGSSPDAATGEYLTLLRTAAAAARAASPQVRIVAATTPALDLVDEFPTPENLEDIVSNVSPIVCGAVLATDEILAARDAYDIVAVHSVSDYTGLATLADWVATLADKPAPVWMTSATSAPALLAEPQMLQVNPQFPTIGEDLWDVLANRSDPRHDLVEAWYRAEQARLAVKKWVYAAAYGYEALVLGLEQDHPNLEDPDLGLRDLAFQGLSDPLSGAGAPAPRPVVAALAAVQSRLTGYSHLERLQGLGEGVEAFTFLVGGAPVTMMWYDDGVAQGPEETMPSTTVTLDVRAAEVTMLEIPTMRGQTLPTATVLAAGEGVVTIPVTETPIMIVGDLAQIFLPRVQR